MKGIKKHTHADREKIVNDMVPLIQEKFGDNLVALASQASYARGDDADYSDLELIAFLREMPGGKEVEGMSRIRDGLLVELVWTTRETYLKTVKEVTKDWYIAGSDTLFPIINEDFINNLNEYRVENFREKCLKELLRFWSVVQESTAKVLNAISQKNSDGLPLLLFYLVYHMLIALSLINQTPYVTMSRFFTMARSFSVKPEKFEALLDMVVAGQYQDFPALQRLITDIFRDFEEILERLDIEVYHNIIDPTESGDIYTIK